MGGEGAARCPLPSSRVVGFVAGIGWLLAACLGMDHLDLPLDLSEWDHGWLDTIESDEELGVGLRANPLYPDAPWSWLRPS